MLVNIEIFRLFPQLLLKFQHNEQYYTLLTVIPCAHKLKAGIAYWSIVTVKSQLYPPSKGYL
jgi:hypothetical protein